MSPRAARVWLRLALGIASVLFALAVEAAYADRYTDPALRVAIYIAALAAVYLCASLAASFTRRRT